MSEELQSWGQFDAAGNELGIEGAGYFVRRLCAVTEPVGRITRLKIGNSS